MLKLFIRLERLDGGIVNEFIPAILVLHDESLELIRKAEQFVDENKRTNSISLDLWERPGGADIKFLEEFTPDLCGIEAIFAKTTPSYIPVSADVSPTLIARSTVHTSFGVVFDGGDCKVRYQSGAVLRIEGVKGQEYVFDEDFLDKYQPTDFEGGSEGVDPMEKADLDALKAAYEG